MNFTTPASDNRMEKLEHTYISQRRRALLLTATLTSDAAPGFEIQILIISLPSMFRHM